MRDAFCFIDNAFFSRCRPSPIPFPILLTSAYPPTAPKASTAARPAIQPADRGKGSVALLPIEMNPKSSCNPPVTFPVSPHISLCSLCAKVPFPLQPRRSKACPYTYTYQFFNPLDNSTSISVRYIPFLYLFRRDLVERTILLRRFDLAANLYNFPVSFKAVVAFRLAAWKEENSSLP